MRAAGSSLILTQCLSVSGGLLLTRRPSRGRTAAAGAGTPCRGGPASCGGRASRPSGPAGGAAACSGSETALCNTRRDTFSVFPCATSSSKKENKEKNEEN